MPIAVLAALVLAVGLAACGGSDSSDSTAAEAGGQGHSEGKSSGNGSKPGAKSGAGEGKSGSGDGEGQSGNSGSGASQFVPKHHNDSGGGAKQYKVKGGDNSVQESGAEAAPSELDAAAVVLHNFLDARAEGNWAAACEYMSKAVVESFEKLAGQAKQIDGKSCGAILEQLTNPAAKQAMKVEAEKADVGSLRVDGDRSFIIYTGAEGTIFAMPMTNESGEWKVSSLAGTPLN